MICQSMIQMGNESKMKRLLMHRDQLRLKLKDHFCLPVLKRDYKRFEQIVDELDSVRVEIQKLKGRR